MVITLDPIGVVEGGRDEAIDDNWGSVEATIRLDADRFGPESVAGLDAFSHLCVVFQFHLVEERDVVTGLVARVGTPSGRPWGCSPSAPRCGRIASA